MFGLFNLLNKPTRLNFVLHDFAEAFFTFSICTHKCDLIYALKKNNGLPCADVHGTYKYSNRFKTDSSAGLNRFMCRFEQVHVQV
jgi:hypothetical protein